MKVIVTGGAGFIGSHVADFLQKNGHKVLVIDDLSGGVENNIPANCDFVKKSVTDNLEDVFKRFAPDAVYHLAAYAAEGLSHHIPLFNYRNNLIGTVNVLVAAYKAKCKHFVFTSSIAVYGHPSSSSAEPFKETDYCTPCDPYGTAKLACEFHIKSFVKYYEAMRYTIFRPHNVFGARQNIADPYRNVVGIFMAKALQKQPMPVFGDGTQTRSFTYIDLVAESIASAPFTEKAFNETFNIGGDEKINVNELADKISRVFHQPLNMVHLPERKEVLHAHCNHAKAKSVFADIYKKSTGIDEGLKLMAEYVTANPIPAVTECPSDIEIFDLLPESWLSRLKTTQKK